MKERNENKLVRGLHRKKNLRELIGDTKYRFSEEKQNTKKHNSLFIWRATMQKTIMFKMFWEDQKRNSVFKLQGNRFQLNLKKVILTVIAVQQ